METHSTHLDVPHQESPVSERDEYQEPQGDLERAIAELWKDLFHTQRIGRNDNFFALGGNSLLGMDLSDMFVTRLSVEVPVLAIFQHPTVTELAQVIAAQ